MSAELEDLLKAARSQKPSREQEEEQRRSFVYGNTAFENPLITREMVDKAAEAMNRDDAARERR